MITAAALLLCTATLYNNSFAMASNDKETPSSFLRGGGNNNRGLREENRIGRSSSGIAATSDNTLVVPAHLETTTAEIADPPCSVHVELTCPEEEPLEINNGCEGPFRVVTMRYNGGGCDQSDSLQSRHGFACIDSANPPSTIVGTENYIVVTTTSRSGNNEKTYFEGPIVVGDEYTLNAEEEFDVLEGEMRIDVYDSEGGNLLQTTTNVLLDCSNPVFLFDSFGSSQVTSWKEAYTGRVVDFSPSPELRTGGVGVVIVNNNGNNNSTTTTPIRLVEMTLLTNVQDEPFNLTDTVKNLELQPEEKWELPGAYYFDYYAGSLPKTRYTFFTTVIAEPLLSAVTDNTISYNSGDASGRRLTAGQHCIDYAQIECVL